MSDFSISVRVYYEDTDRGGVVYHSNYLNFMERARTELLRSYGIEQDDLLEQDGIIFAVHNVEVDFLKPARFNDLLQVTAEVIDNSRASISFLQQVSCDNEVMCSGQVKIVCLNAASFKPVPVPGHLLTSILTETTRVH
ncbi:MAG: hypothetical protein BMS9Abin26_1070 [Gammaproteobacteria bacterium]|nr:MAG: hypothetical protein BMS9Abin26_1070 [Gammaproteobacteria bacterium]